MTRKHTQRTRGQSLIELAISLPLLIILLGGLVDVGRAFLILTAVENATGEGALYGATNPGCLPADNICTGDESVTGRVKAEGKPAVNMTDENSVINVVVEEGVVQKDSTLRVDVTYTYAPLTPIGMIIWGEKASVKATARQRVMSPPPPDYLY